MSSKNKKRLQTVPETVEETVAIDNAETVNEEETTVPFQEEASVDTPTVSDEEIFAQLAPEIDYRALVEKLTRELEAVKADLAAANTKPDRGVYFNAKNGAVKIFGIGVQAFSLYRDQIEGVLAHQEELKKFVEAHAAKLTNKTLKVDKAA